MKKKQTKQEGIEVSGEDRYVDRCGAGLLDGQRHACVDQEQTNHIAQPRAPCNMQARLLSGVLKHLSAPTHKLHYSGVLKHLSAPTHKPHYSGVLKSSH